MWYSDPRYCVATPSRIIFYLKFKPHLFLNEFLQLHLLHLKESNDIIATVIGMSIAVYTHRVDVLLLELAQLQNRPGWPVKKKRKKVDIFFPLRGGNYKKAILEITSLFMTSSV